MPRLPGLVRIAIPITLSAQSLLRANEPVVQPSSTPSQQSEVGCSRVFAQPVVKTQQLNERRLQWALKGFHSSSFSL
jgi:hypothetical protein